MKLVCTYSDGKVGVGQELARYLQEQGEDFLFLEHPLNAGGTGSRSWLRRYEAGRLVSDRPLGLALRGGSLSYVQGALITFRVVLRRRRALDLFVGHSNVDCVAAFLGALGRRMKIVYVSIDYTPRRFPGRLMNSVFAVADRLAYRCAAQVWHSYPDAEKLKPHADPRKCLTTFHGNNFRRIRRLPWSERNRFGLVYLGGVQPHAHIEEALECVAALRGRFPATALHVIGDSPDPAYLPLLRRKAESLGVSDRVAWHGLITESAAFEGIMAQQGVALCLYEMAPDRPSWYQLPGKVFAYAACGLPTVALDRGGPVCRREIEANRIGWVTGLGALAQTLGGIFGDPAGHERTAASAAQWASQYDWGDKFRRLLAGLAGPEAAAAPGAKGAG